MILLDFPARRMDMACRELQASMPAASLSARWAALVGRWPDLGQPERAQAVQKRRFNRAVADFVITALRRGDRPTLLEAGVYGLWHRKSRYLLADERPLPPLARIHCEIRDGVDLFGRLLVSPDSRLIRLCLSRLLEDPAGLAYYELPVVWQDELAGWSRPDLGDFAPLLMDELLPEEAATLHAVLYQEAIGGLGHSALDAAQDAYDYDQFLFDLGHRIRPYAAGVPWTEEVAYVAPCSVRLAHQVQALGGADVPWIWTGEKVDLAIDILH